jgi:hypothetical protein
MAFGTKVRQVPTILTKVFRALSQSIQSNAFEQARIIFFQISSVVSRGHLPPFKAK